MKSPKGFTHRSSTVTFPHGRVNRVDPPNGVPRSYNGRRFEDSKNSFSRLAKAEIRLYPPANPADQVGQPIPLDQGGIFRHKRLSPAQRPHTGLLHCARGQSGGHGARLLDDLHRAAQGRRRSPGGMKSTGASTLVSHGLWPWRHLRTWIQVESTQKLQSPKISLQAPNFSGDLGLDPQTVRGSGHLSLS